MLAAVKLDLEGYPTSEIASKLGICMDTVHRWKRSELWLMGINQYITPVQSKGELHLRSLVPVATHALKDLVQVATPAIRLQAAKFILEMAHELRVEEEQREQIIRLEGQMEELAAVAQRQLSGDVLEAQITEVKTEELHAPLHATQQEKEETSPQQEK